jgi:lysophospholipase L1-like esterase
MKLSFTQIKEITTGALSIKESDGGIEFSKLTQAQVDFWESRSAIMHKRARATSGIRLDFHSNTKKLSYKISTPTDEYAKSEVLIDGERVYANAVGDTTEEFAIGDGSEHRITVIFPSHDIGFLQYVEIDDGATLVPHEYKMKILFFGDSITQGSRAPLDSLSYAYKTSFHFDADSVIQGVGGGFFYHGIFDSSIEYDPDIVIIAYGTNDYARYTEFDVIIERAEDVVSSICERYRGKKIFAITPLRRYDWAMEISTGKFEDLRARYAEVYRKYGVNIIDGYTLMDDDRSLYDDGLHPNREGFVQYTANLCAILEANI